MRISSPPPPPFNYAAPSADQQAARRTAATAVSPARTMTVAQLVASENRSSALSGTIDLNDASLADFAGKSTTTARRADLKI